ncbi:MAG: T9SS type A sorting domain-containing protein [Sphingobacteriales bacterium]|nr:MAG: T9SS type A sorting domain-containing protein [Sphingobacteriales bacterium]
MKKSLLTIAAMSVVTVYAQEHEHDLSCEAQHPKRLSVYENGIATNKSALKLKSFTDETYQQLQLAAPDNGSKLTEGFDYFPAPMFLDESYKSNTAGHKVEQYLHKGINASLGGTTFQQLDCTEIHDAYDITYPGTGITYHYSNTYFHFRNNEGTDLATLSYIKRSRGSLFTESSNLKIYVAATGIPSLQVFPNPAREVIQARIAITKEGVYSLQVFDLSGRVVMTPAQNKFFSSGTHNLAVPTGNLSGHYYITLTGKTHTTTQSITVTK